MMIGTFDSMDAEIDRGEGGKRSEEGTYGSSCDSGDVNFFSHCNSTISKECQQSMDC